MMWNFLKSGLSTCGAPGRQVKLKGTFALDTERLLAESLQRGSQVIMFRNRRGYAPLARCRQCAWTPRCEQCDVALTYHSHLRQLQCHYCGAVYPLPKVCPECKEPAIEILGYGTERVEEEVAQRFPGKKCCAWISIPPATRIPTPG